MTEESEYYDMVEQKQRLAMHIVGSAMYDKRGRLIIPKDVLVFDDDWAYRGRVMKKRGKAVLIENVSIGLVDERFSWDLLKDAFPDIEFIAEFGLIPISEKRRDQALNLGDIVRKNKYYQKLQIPDGPYVRLYALQNFTSGYDEKSDISIVLDKDALENID